MRDASNPGGKRRHQRQPRSSHKHSDRALTTRSSLLTPKGTRATVEASKTKSTGHSMKLSNNPSPSMSRNPPLSRFPIRARSWPVSTAKSGYSTTSVVHSTPDCSSSSAFPSSSDPTSSISIRALPPPLFPSLAWPSSLLRLSAGSSSPS